MISDLGIKIVEIKSTRVTQRHKNYRGDIVFEKILMDDFLTYPKYLRNSEDITTKEKYYSYCKMKNSNYDLKEELSNMSDIYIRVYMDDNQKKGFIIGYIDKYTFFNNMQLKKMEKFRKSERALYWAVNLKKGFPIKSLTKEFYLKAV